MTFEEILKEIQDKHICFPGDQFIELKEVDQDWTVRRGSNGWETVTYQYEDRYIQVCVLRDTDGEYEEFEWAKEALKSQRTIDVYIPKESV